MELVDIRNIVPGAMFDLRYATTRNISGSVLTDNAVPRLQAVAAAALQAVSLELQSQGVRLLVWDAYRTPETQVQLRTFSSDERYVLEESNHCNGLAVDLTLVDEMGTPLDMGTDFDDFTDKAHANAAGLSAAQLQARLLLTDTMQHHGFKQWPYEWWHFDYGGADTSPMV